MKWSITYFYNVRFFRQSQLPLSTAMFPPHWYAKSNKSEAFIDKRGIVNGLTIDQLVPKQEDECPCKKKDWQHCRFLSDYYRQLQNKDFQHLMEMYEFLAEGISKILGHQIDEIVLLVFEKPEKLCSERTVLKKWFKENGVNLAEWRKEE